MFGPFVVVAQIYQLPLLLDQNFQINITIQKSTRILALRSPSEGIQFQVIIKSPTQYCCHVASPAHVPECLK